jgi:ATP-binding cassette, subfamily G (WHITE), member 2, SNQ2
VSIFNGIVRPYESLPVFWKYWVYWINPSTWWIGGVLAAVLADETVQCAPGETTLFDAPAGQTCGDYAADFIQQGMGYITNPDATTDCGYCQYANGAEYLSTLNISPSDKWRDLGIFVVFVFSNWALVYFFIYCCRVKGWTFGMGPLFAFGGGLADKVKGLFSRKGKKALDEEGVEKA